MQNSNTISITKTDRNRFKLETSVELSKPLEKVFDFFSKAENLEVLTPEYLNFKILTPLPITMNEGRLIDYQIRLFGIPIRWRTEIKQWNPPHSFMDTQLKGPYLLWEHTHSFESLGERGTRMIDVVEYSVPGGMLIDFLFVRKKLLAIFNFRRKKMLEIATTWETNL
jgi:ligand-binding SRPBCC domain-containing protein